MQHDDRTCENSKPCFECEYPTCRHENDIFYGELEQVDGEPQYKVRCETCQAKGIIYLSETSEEWEMPKTTAKVSQKKIDNDTAGSRYPKLDKLFAKVSPAKRKPSNYPPNFNPQELDN